MDVTVCVVARKKSGILAEIFRTTVTHGCSLRSQKSEESTPPGHLRIELKCATKNSDLSPLLEGIRQIQGVVEIQAVETTKAVETAKADPPDTLVRAAFDTIIKAYPNVLAPVASLCDALPPEARQEWLFLLGRKIGAREYKRNYALGNPLRLRDALRRMLIPALKPFADATAAETEVRISDCPFCRGRSEGTACQGFLAGFLQGFLEANPLTAQVSVRQTHCAAHGHMQCTFEVSDG